MSHDITIVFPLYPGVTQLDFTGPLELLWRIPGARCRLASVAGGTLATDTGLAFAELERLDAIEACTILCVPGGYGTIAALNDDAYVGHVRRLGQTARYVTSVCTGSLLLAAAGLLRGKRAACHWAWRDALTAFGVTPDPARVVRDGHVLTGGGVTAGIDLALTIIAEVAGRDVAEAIQLGVEYAPAPPFEAGRPELARPSIRAVVEQRLTAVRDEREAAIARAVARLADQR